MHRPSFLLHQRKHPERPAAAARHLRACGHVFPFSCLLAPSHGVCQTQAAVPPAATTLLVVASVWLGPPRVHTPGRSGVWQRGLVGHGRPVTGGLASWESCRRPWHRHSQWLCRGEPALWSQVTWCAPVSSLSLFSSAHDHCTCRPSSVLTRPSHDRVVAVC